MVIEIDKEKLAQAKLEIARRLDQAEKERAFLRLQSGVKELARHDFAILTNDQFVEELTRYLCDFDSLNDLQPIVAVLDNIGIGCRSDNRKVRERALVILSVFSEYILENDKFDFITKLSDILVKWLERETEYLSGFAIICRQIQKIGMKLLVNHYWVEAENLLTLLNKIQNGILKKSNTIKGIVAKIYENIAAKNVLEILTGIYLDTSQKDHKIAGRILKNLGRRSIIFLLNRLMHSEDKIERFRLMGLIPQTGAAISPVFEECLRKNPPWYVVRNIVSMISELGDTSLFSLVEDCLRHPDIRVQQEVIVCIEKLGGMEMKNRLLLALKNVHVDLKAELVLKISQFTGSDVTAALVDLFEKRATFSDSAADELLLVLCIAMGSFPNKRAVQNIKQFVEERKKRKNSSDRLLLTAEEILSVIEPKVRHDLKGEVEALDELTFDYEPVSEHDAKQKVRNFIEEIHQIVAKGNVGKASELLYAEAVAAAKNKDFKVAELLRDKILEINPIALAEVLEIGGIIEDEKSTSISSNHIEIWNELYQKMTTEEFNALYSAMKRETYNPEETIIKCGETDQSLFFINSGVVRLSCMCGNKETFLKRLQPGEIIGVGQFFSLSIWTVSLVSQNTTQIHVLELEGFKKIKDRFPDIEKKLHDYCLQFDTIPALLRMAGEDRREYARYVFPANISSMTLDPYGRKRQYSLEGELIDISRGGLSFIPRISRGVSTKFLLGRQIISEIHIDSGEKLKCAGVIVGVGFPQAEKMAFSIHVKFFNLMKKKDFARVNRST